jgi:hypothetical protein
MQSAVLPAALLVAAGAVAQARDFKPADVIVYVQGESGPPSPVDYGARATVSWMFARVGVRLAWHDGDAAAARRFDGPLVMQVLFAPETRGESNPEVLAYALPFGDGRSAITVMYGRVRAIAGHSSREQPVLAYVLAHEIGHSLQRTNAHAPDGIMKAHWSAEDYDAMERNWLGFTSTDVELIRAGLNKLKAR